MAASLDPTPTVADDWIALGCAVRLVVADPRDLETARLLLTGELVAIDLACSRFRPDSELMRVPTGTTAQISPLLAAAIGIALDAAAQTDGDVDPTVGAAMAAVGYDRDFGRVEMTGDPITVLHRPVPGWRRIKLDRAAGTVVIPDGVVLDLGATAKAFVADRAAARIATAIDGRGVMVSLGGDIAVAGAIPPAGWSIRVQDVTGPVTEPAVGPSQVIGLWGGGLATSSTTARRWVRGGRVMHHILDPRNGVPVTSSWRTVSVVAPTCLEANVASTAAIVRGEAALAWLMARGLPARLVDVDGVVTILPGWPLETGSSETVSLDTAQ